MSDYISRLCPAHREWDMDIDNPEQCPKCPPPHEKVHALEAKIEALETELAKAENELKTQKPDHKHKFGVKGQSEDYCSICEVHIAETVEYWKKDCFEWQKGFVEAMNKAEKAEKDLNRLLAENEELREVRDFALAMVRKKKDRDTRPGNSSEPWRLDVDHLRKRLDEEFAEWKNPPQRNPMATRYGPDFGWDPPPFDEAGELIDIANLAWFVWEALRRKEEDRECAERD